MVAISRAEQRRRWRQKYPEKVRIERRKYLDRKFQKNPALLDGLKGQILADFERLTRIMYDEEMPRVCEMCGKTEDLQIHHKRYVYPVVREDLMRLCRHCHVFVHRQVLPTDNIRERV